MCFSTACVFFVKPEIVVSALGNRIQERQAVEMDTKAFPSSTVCFHHTRKIRSLLAWVYLYVCALEKPRERFHDAPYYSGFAFARIDHTLMRLRGLCVYESKGPLLCVQKKG